MTKICKRGHDSPRRSNGNCIGCERERYLKNKEFRERRLAYNRKRRAEIKADPELAAIHREYMRNYVEKNRAKLNERSNVRARLVSIETRLKNKGISLELADSIRTHSGLCDICGKPPDGRWKTLNIDHCHETGAFRGMLCAKCNKGLGLFYDNPAFLLAAVNYLNRKRHEFECVHG